MQLDKREIATVLAALRLWQMWQIGENYRTINIPVLDEIASADGEVEPLTNIEVDALCERINAGAGE